MLDKYKYTDSEMKQILSGLVILYDSREQKNKHILSWFDSKKIRYKEQKLDWGDYSFFIPSNPELSIHRDIHFTNEISIERKGSLDELIGNFANDRDRISDEFLRHKGKMTLLIEDSSYKDIYEGNYSSKYSKQSALGTLHSLSDRYNVPVMFIDKEYTAKYIYFSFYYHLRNKLK